MKKFPVWILSTFSYLTLVAAPALAADTPISPCSETGPFAFLCNLSSGNFGGLIGTFINFLFVVAIIIAVLYFIYGGIKYIMSRGEKEQVEESRNHIVAATVGLIITFLAFFIINIVLGFFTPGQNLNNLTLPSIGNCPGQCAVGTCPANFKATANAANTCPASGSSPQIRCVPN